MTESTCQLCRQVRPLLKKSHVIPDFMYRDLFDKHHKLNLFAPADYIRGQGRVARPSSGEYEANILCQPCDNQIIGSYESYGKMVLYDNATGSPNDPIIQHGVTEKGIPVTRFSNVDYRKFKLFLLSILWRASISTRPFFRDVNLGRYQEPIREMILTADPGTADRFPILMISWVLNDPALSDQIAEPSKNRATLGIRYVFIIAGMTYVFHVSPASMESKYMPFTILPNNTFSILYIPQGKGSELFQTYFGI